ncbi:MAG: hypothetical protein N3G80_00715 [Candidatus Micrarchaeota archaeon]|nr:hypothetical protein [Candidatus Micrarchaeota archaeon]
MALCANDAFLYNVIYSTAGMALATMISVVIISYMAANFFRRPEYEAFSSIELYQLAVSAFLFISIFGATCFAAEMTELLTGRDPYEIGKEYLTFINQKMLITAASMKAAVLRFQYHAAWSMRWGPAAWGTINLTFPSAVLFERIFDFLSIIIVPFTASLMVQQLILEAIQAVLIPFLLPAAVLTRIFPPLRDASAFLISVAIGFGILFPYSYAMHAYIVPKMMEKTFKQASSQQFEERLAQQYPNFMAEVSYSKFFSLESILFDPLLTLSYLLLQALFLPALSMTLTIAFIRSFTKFIGQKLG